MKFENAIVIHGDCLEVLPRMRAKSVDMILCDLPYGSTQNKWDSILPFDVLLEQYERILKENAALVLFGMGLFSAKMVVSFEKYYRYSLIWQKSHSVGFLNANRMPLRSHEDIHVFYKKLPIYHPQMEEKPKENIRPITTKNRKSSNYGVFDEGNHRTCEVTQSFPKSILSFPTNKTRDVFHPTQKPTSLLEYLIKTYTDEGMVILDHCMGSGSTLVAALQTGRKCIGIEKEEKYYAIAVNRVKEVLKQIHSSE